MSLTALLDLPEPQAPRVHLVTLGVADVAAATAFYERLGLTKSSASNEQVSFFQLGPLALGLFGRASLAADAQVADGAAGFSGVTLAWNLVSEAAVDEAFQRMLAAGATAKKAPQTVFWGGYSGYVADLDGHLWELAYNPFFPLDAAGAVVLP